MTPATMPEPDPMTMPMPVGEPMNPLAKTKAVKPKPADMPADPMMPPADMPKPPKPAKKPKK